VPGTREPSLEDGGIPDSANGASAVPALPLGSVSVRVFWPFARVLGDYEHELSLLREAGVDLVTFADPFARIPKTLGRQLLMASLQKSKDPSLGLHAGERVELADFAPVDQVTRHCATLREAVVYACQYSKLNDEGVQTELVETGSRALVVIRNDDPHRHAVVNEFQVMATLKRLGLFLHQDVVPLEIHLRNEVATNAAEYDRVFRSPVRLGAEQNAVVIARSLLDVRAAHANAALFPLFHEQARRAMQRLTREASFSQRVRDLLEQGLEEGRTGMTDVARRLNLSEATLRRRLCEEQTTHKELLDRVRRERALSQIEARRASLGEIGFRLGFSSPSAFGRAFRRWVGISPFEYRAKLKEH
jgi:AraC-like DNA-binding protein